MNFAQFFLLSFSLCLQFVARIILTALFGWFIDRYFNIFPFTTVALSIFGVYLGSRALIAVRDRKYDDA
jgi:F0F1-type ATP synthase assembly protein I